MANHASTRTTQLYDRRRDEVKWLDARRVPLEQARLEVFGLARHFRLSPFLDSDNRKPRSASTSVRRDRRISSGKRGSSLISN
jgi:hypothetical protein